MHTDTPIDTDFPQTLLQRGSAPLPHWGVIQAQGEEAAHFLHNQLTQDVLLLPVGQARLAAFCSAKGRMQASGVLIKTAPDTVLLVLNHDLLAQTLKRLSMFVMRAKVKLTDASAQWQLRGLLGASAQALMGPQEAAPWQCVTHDSVHAVALYPAKISDSAIPRALWLAPAGHALPVEPEISTQLWQWAEVMSGVALLSCYPGQEVVARSQFRGTLKRRTALVHSPVALVTGQEVFTPTAPDQACATVVLAAARPQADGHHQGFDALISGTLESMQTGWHVGAADGAPLTFMPLPYALLEDI
jgi:folate-binding Fe-S cluster repair protein YgfZ